MMNDDDFYPDKNKPEGAGNACPLGGFSGDEDFYLEYVESLMEGDIRPIILKSYIEGEK